jgi:hypothetical protein
MHPEVCIFYQEVDISNNLKKPVCVLHDIQINHKNLSIIENCQDHKTFKQLKDEWKNFA